MDYKELARNAKVMAESFRREGNVYLPNRLEMHATAITDLLARAEAAEAENAVLRRMQPVKIDGDTLELAAEVSELRKKLETIEKERDEAVKCIAEKCMHVESTERGNYCTIDDEPCDCCEGIWRIQKEE